MEEPGKPYRIAIIDPIEYKRLKEFFEFANLDSIQVVYAHAALPNHYECLRLPLVDAVIFGLHMPIFTLDKTTKLSVRNQSAISQILTVLRNIQLSPWGVCPVILRNKDWGLFQEHPANHFGHKKLIDHGVEPGSPLDLLKLLCYLGAPIEANDLRIIRGTLHLRPQI